MPQRATPLQPGFSVADADGVEFNFREGELLLEFLDWTQTVVRVRFENAAGMGWSELDSGGPEDRDDSVYEITESEWLAKYIDAGARTIEDRLRHFRLYFNAWGTLDVLASSMRPENC